MISVNDFEHWLSHAKGGSRFVYHQGLLAQDVLNSTEAVELRRLTWRAYEEGLVILTQRRLGDPEGSQMEYIAQRRDV